MGQQTYLFAQLDLIDSWFQLQVVSQVYYVLCSPGRQVSPRLGFLLTGNQSASEYAIWLRKKI